MGVRTDGTMIAGDGHVQAHGNPDDQERHDAAVRTSKAERRAAFKDPPIVACASISIELDFSKIAKLMAAPQPVRPAGASTATKVIPSFGRVKHIDRFAQPPQRMQA